MLIEMQRSLTETKRCLNIWGESVEFGLPVFFHGEEMYVVPVDE